MSQQTVDVAEVDRLLQASWKATKDALRRGDISTALTFIHSQSRARYQAFFNVLTPTQLAGIDQFMTTIQPVEIAAGQAEYEMLRPRGGQMLSFQVLFEVDFDGVWRLRMF